MTIDFDDGLVYLPAVMSCDGHLEALAAWEWELAALDSGPPGLTFGLMAEIGPDPAGDWRGFVWRADGSRGHTYGLGPGGSPPFAPTNESDPCARMRTSMSRLERDILNRLADHVYEPWAVLEAEAITLPEPWTTDALWEHHRNAPHIRRSVIEKARAAAT